VNARRAGWRGFNYDLESAGNRLILVAEGRLPIPRGSGELEGGQEILY
jgi:hypothetical protein